MATVATVTELYDHLRVLYAAIGIPISLFIGYGYISTLPRELDEAARVDGAGWWASTRHITMPLLRNVSFMTWILMAIFSVNDFPTVWLLTGGGPIGATQSLVVYAYELVFQEFHTGQGIAIAVFATLIAGGMAIGLFRFLNPASGERTRKVAQ